MGKIGLTQAPGRVDLRKKYLFMGAIFRPPGFDPPLQRAQLAVAKLTRVAALQIAKQRVGL